MFSLDTNFLNDPGRQDYTGSGKGAKPVRASVGTGSPILPILGAIVGIAIPAALGGYWYYLTYQEIPKLQARSTELDGQIASLQAKLVEAAEFEKQAAAIEADITAFSSVFDKIRPWSAILLDIAQRTPPDVEIKSIAEASGIVTITGTAISQTAPPYDKANDFLLVLQRSPFFEKQETRMTGTALQETKPNIETGAAEKLFEFTRLEVTFTITAKLANKPNSELLAELTKLQARGVAEKVRRTAQIQQGIATSPSPAASPLPQPTPGGTPQ